MKKVLLFITIISIAPLANGQKYIPFPDSNAVWRTVNYSPQCQSPGYCKYEDSISGDTTINSLLYHKIFERNNTTFTWHYEAALREASKKIYIIHNTTAEILYYDFTILPGDTIAVPQGDTLNLTSVDSILINGTYRKQFHFQDGGYGDTPVWIEGIGSEYGLFCPAPFHYPWAYFWYLCCYLQNNTLMFNQDIAPFTYCYELTSLQSFSADISQINIFPNPSAGNISIESPAQAIIEISNIQGQLIKTLAASGAKTNVDHIGLSSYVVDVSALPCGVYIVEVRTEKGVAVKKFIKE